MTWRLDPEACFLVICVEEVFEDLKRCLTHRVPDVRGIGPCNFTQPPQWPCPEEELRRHAFPEAGEEFLREAAAFAQAKERP